MDKQRERQTQRAFAVVFAIALWLLFFMCAAVLVMTSMTLSDITCRMPAAKLSSDVWHPASSISISCRAKNEQIINVTFAALMVLVVGIAVGYQTWVAVTF